MSSIILNCFSSMGEGLMDTHTTSPHSQTRILLIRPKYSFYGLSQTSSFVSQQFGLKSDLVWLVFLQ